MTTTESDVEALRRELADLRERMGAGNPQQDDSIAVARREIEAQFFRKTPSLMDTPCQHLYNDGRMCGMSWKIDNDTIREVHRIPALGTHSYQPTRIESSPLQAGGAYRLSRGEQKHWGIEEPQSKTAEQTYMSEKQASAALKVTVKALRVMVTSGTVEAHKIADVSLIVRTSVERIIAMAEIAKDEGIEDESDG